MNTDHTCDLPEMRSIFQLYYCTVNQSHSQDVITDRFHGVYQQQ